MARHVHELSGNRMALIDGAELLDFSAADMAAAVARGDVSSAELVEAQIECVEQVIVVGKTNVAQMLLYYESDNPLYGRTNNPWDLQRSCAPVGLTAAVG